MKRLLFICLLFSITNIFANSVEEKVLEASNTMKKLVRSQNGVPMPIIKKHKQLL